MILGKILYVDDDKLLTSTFSTLMKVEGFKDVVVYNDPIKAIEYLKTNSPDLIISDFLMPEMNGLEFLIKRMLLKQLMKSGFINILKNLGIMMI